VVSRWVRAPVRIFDKSKTKQGTRHKIIKRVLPVLWTKARLLEKHHIRLVTIELVQRAETLGGGSLVVTGMSFSFSRPDLPEIKNMSIAY
jgi:hypothetical protein